MYSAGVGLLPGRLGDLLGLQAHAQATHHRRTLGLTAHHRRVDEWRHQVAHTDAVLAPLQFQRLGKPAHGELAGRVTGQLWHAVERRGRAHIDHLRVRRGLEIDKGCMAEVEHAEHIDLYQACVLLQPDIGEGAGTQDACAIEQQAQLAAALRAEVGQRGIRRCGIDHIQRRMPGAAQLGGQGCQRLFIDVEQPDAPAPRVKQPRGGGANARGGAADENVVHHTPRSRRKAATRAMA